MNFDEIKLKPFSLEYSDELFNLVEENREYLRKFLPWLDSNTEKEHSKNFIKEMLRRIELGENGVSYFIFNKDKMIGVIDTHHIDKDKKSFHVGYWISENMQGKGIMSYSADLVVQEMFKRGFKTAEIRCSTVNPKSCAIAKKLGFERKEILEKESELNGQKIDMEVWQKTI